MTSEIVWIGPYPAHYTRRFHRAVEERWPGRFRFVYVHRLGRGDRGYETGELPQRTVVLTDSGAVTKVIDVLSPLDDPIIVVNGHVPAPLAAALVWTLARGKRLVYRADTSLIDVLRTRNFARKLFHRTLGRTVLSRAAAILPIGSQNRAYYRWAIGAGFEDIETFRVPYPHAMTPGPGTRGRIGPGEPLTFLYLGRLVSEKAVRALIRAASLLGDRAGGWRLLVAGDGPERDRLEDMVQHRGLEDRVVFLGEVESAGRSEVFEDADVFVLPSEREPWGLVVNEALSAGLPVIAPYWIGAASDLLVDRYDGRVLSSNDPGEIADAMAAMVDDPGRVSRMAERGRDLVVEGGWTLEGALDGLADMLSTLG